MRIILTESQYKKLLNEAESFYTQSPVLPEYEFNDGSKFSVIPMNAIPVSALYPKGVPKEGYPKKIWTYQVQELLRNNPSQTNKDPLGLKASSEYNAKKIFNAPYAPPFDWQSEQEKYSRFYEPLGKVDKFVVGKYRGSDRGMLPPQTNKYYFDNQQGRWVVKGLNNVNNWRDVPAGYYPPDYPKALEMEEKIKWSNKERENRYVMSQRAYATDPKYKGPPPFANRDLVFFNPYFQKKYPLGLPQEEYEAINNYARHMRNEIEKLYRSLSPNEERRFLDNYGPPKGYVSERDRKIKELQSQLEEAQNLFGYYVEQQPKNSSGFDWLGFSLTLASLLPVVGPAAFAANLGINLVRAAKAMSENKPFEAGLHLLFAAVPTASSTLRGINVFKLINGTATAAEKTVAEQILKQNASSWFQGAKGIITREVEALGSPFLAKVGDNATKKFVEEFSAKKVIKNAAETADEEFQSLTQPPKQTS